MLLSLQFSYAQNGACWFTLRSSISTSHRHLLIVFPFPYRCKCGFDRVFFTIDSRPTFAKDYDEMHFLFPLSRLLSINSSHCAIFEQSTYILCTAFTSNEKLFSTCSAIVSKVKITPIYVYNSLSFTFTITYGADLPYI